MKNFDGNDTVIILDRETDRFRDKNGNVMNIKLFYDPEDDPDDNFVGAIDNKFGVSQYDHWETHMKTLEDLLRKKDTAIEKIYSEVAFRDYIDKDSSLSATDIGIYLMNCNARKISNWINIMQKLLPMKQ